MQLTEKVHQNLLKISRLDLLNLWNHKKIRRPANDFGQAASI